MTSFTLTGVAYELAPVTIGQIEDLQALLEQKDLSTVRRTLATLNVAIGESAPAIDRSNRATLPELIAAYRIVLQWAGFVSAAETRSGAGAETRSGEGEAAPAAA